MGVEVASYKDVCLQSSAIAAEGAKKLKKKLDNSWTQKEQS